MYGAETWPLQTVDQKYLKNFLNVMLEKDGDQMDQLHHELRSITITEGRNILRTT